MNINDIPKKIIEFIENDECKIIFRNNESRNYLCQNCLCELTHDFKCPKCSKDYKFKSFTDYINHTALKKRDGYINNTAYSYFDVVDNNAILYGLKSETIFTKKGKKRNLSVEYVYEIKEDGVYDYIKNEQIYNHNSDNNYILYFRSIDKNIFMKHTILYLDNLEILKKTIYNNTNIWLDKTYLNNFDYLSLLNIIYAPLYYNDYQYLKELGLKNLAYLNKFYEIDDTVLIEKKDVADHLKFMKSIDIDYPHYIALMKTNEENVEILNQYIKKVLYNE